jgi:hypothetical protein
LIEILNEAGKLRRWNAREESATGGLAQGGSPLQFLASG